MKVAVNVLVIVVLFSSLLVSIRDIKYIDLRVLGHIFLYMIPGIPIGMWLFNILPEKPLKIALGIFMIWVGTKGLYHAFVKKPQSQQCLRNTLHNTSGSKRKHGLLSSCLFLGGIVHGAFTCGGPFVVIYAKENFP